MIVLEYRNISYVSSWSDEVFIIKKVKKTLPWTDVISDFNGEKIVGIIYKTELRKTNQREFTVEKVIKRKDYKLYIKWRGFHRFFNSWVDKKDIM